MDSITPEELKAVKDRLLNSPKSPPTPFNDLSDAFDVIVDSFDGHGQRISFEDFYKVMMINNPIGILSNFQPSPLVSRRTTDE